MSAVLPASRWRELGVRTMNGDPLPDELPDASLVNGESRSFLVSKNYDALLEYNCAHSYAIGVALLADALSPGAPPVAKAAVHKTRRPAKRRASRKS
jgi:membrane-bound lytic murein transglycosylase B